MMPISCNLSPVRSEDINTMVVFSLCGQLGPGFKDETKRQGNGNNHFYTNERNM